MKRLFTILGIIAAVLALVLAVTPLSQIAYVPAIIALACGLVAFYYAKRQPGPHKMIQLIFVLTIIAVVLTTYKFIFHAPEIGDIEEFEMKQDASMEDSKEILEELDIEEFDIDDPSLLDTIEDKEELETDTLENQ